MTTTSKIGVLRVVRDEYLGKNPVVVEARKNLLGAKVARLQALRTLDELNEEKASRAVWVPPSSSRGSKHGTKASVEDLASKLTANKTNARLQTGEVRRLSLKRAFVIWRAMGAVRGEMNRALESIEQDDAVEAVGRALAGWKEVAEPWTYEESVLESAELFRLVCQLGRQDRVMQYWMAIVAKRNDMEARREVFERHMARRVMQDAMIHWKVYRLVHHLKQGREYLAAEFDRVRRLKAAFVHLRCRASRRLRLCERMEAAVFLDQGAQPTVDDLLNLGQFPLVLKGSYVVLDDHLRASLDVPGKMDMICRVTDPQGGIGSFRGASSVIRLRTRPSSLTIQRINLPPPGSRFRCDHQPPAGNRHVGLEAQVARSPRRRRGERACQAALANRPR